MRKHASLIAAATVAVLVSPASAAPGGHTLFIPHGVMSGPVVVHNPTVPVTTKIVNNGTITGGSQAGITVTGSTPTTTVNNGSITGTTGVSVSGASSKVVNTGTITATSSSSSGSTSATGISQTN